MTTEQPDTGATEGTELTAETETGIQRPRRGSWMLPVLVMLAVLYTLVAARSLLIPIILSAFIALFLNPLVMRLRRRWFPRALAALLVLVVALGLVGSGVAMLYGPAHDWVQQAPKTVKDLSRKLRPVTKPLRAAGEATRSLMNLGAETRSGDVSQQVKQTTANALWDALSAAPSALAQSFGVLMLVYFFLVYGEDLARKAVQLHSTTPARRNTIAMIRAVQAEISRYIVTIGAINLALGAATALGLVVIGVRDALLWGVLVAVLNFTPYVGPLVSALCLAVVGLVSFPSLGLALAVPGIYIGLHLIEGQIVTPLVLSRRLSLNPVVILLWLMLWGWLWGIVGLLLGVPMLVCLRIVCAHVEALVPWGRLIEG